MGTIPMESRISRGKNGKLYPRLYPRFALGTPCLVAVSTLFTKKKRTKKRKRTDLPTVAQARLWTSPTARPEGRGDAVAASPAQGRLPHGLFKKEYRNAATSPLNTGMLGGREGVNGKARPYPRGASWELSRLRCRSVGRSLSGL